MPFEGLHGLRACDAQVIQIMLKLRGSTGLEVLQVISETMGSKFERPHW